VEEALLKAEATVQIEEADLLREVENATPDESSSVTQRLKRQLEKASVRASAYSFHCNIYCFCAFCSSFNRSYVM
jgi:uncharacterized iron-regulated membrane protein